MRVLTLALAFALAGCRCDGPSKPAGSGSARVAAERAPAAPPDGSAAGSEGAPAPAAGSRCVAETAIRVSRVLTDPAHPCRGRILAAYGRMVRVGAGSSGVIASTAAARGAGLLVTCGSCAGAAGAGLVEPERDPPLAIRIGAPARLAGGAVPAGPPRHAAHRLFGAEGFALAAISGEPLAPDAAPPAAVGDRDLALDDPRGLAAARAPFVDVRPGASVLVLGFADAEDGELVASVGPVLDDPGAELAIAARALPGMAGGGVFDERGRLVGVVARASGEPVAGAHLVRAVRATAIAARLSAALRAAPVPLRTKIVAFLP